ncbi:transposase [Kitasatospora sp. NA04385]|nr:transposase [Kitasatospora sp. NA04385]
MARRRCHPSDTRDDEWAFIEPPLPKPTCENPAGGRPERHPRREIVDAIRCVVDTKGLPFFVMVTPADITDRDAAKEVLFRLRPMHPEITIVWADSAYAGQLVARAEKYLNLTVKIVSRPKDAWGFVVLPRRWVVERSIAWVMHARRHARDCERLIQHSESLIIWAATTLMTRCITRCQSRRSSQPASREAQRD